MNEMQANIDRFSGFAGLYDENRPKPPEMVMDILLRYLGRTPEIVVDLGSGTGLSTFMWCNQSARVIGVEPNHDMRNQAGLNAAHKCFTNIRFIQATSDNTGLDNNSADIVTCSQSFHWMEPCSTLKEIARILKTGGVFAAYDCDWPPVIGLRLEEAYNTIMSFAREKLKSFPVNKTAYQYSKENHLQNIQKSGYFSYSREIVFHNREECTADRFTNMVLSQGAVQTVLKEKPDTLEKEIQEFKKLVAQHWNQAEIVICYRMRIGIRK